MASIPKVLEFLRIICSATDCITRFPGRGATLLSFLRRKLIVWWRFWFGKSGHPKPAERPLLGTKASSRSVSGSAVVKEYVVAASYVPTSASHARPHERTESQPAAVTQTVSVHHHPVPPSISVDPPRAHDPSSHPLGERSLVNRRYATLSAVSLQSRASDRFSIITTSPGALRAPHDQRSRVPSRVTSRPFGRGTDPSRLRRRPARPPVVDLHDETLSGSPTHTNPPIIPEGRFVQLINSDQIPRYDRGATMQVGYFIPSLHLVTSLQTPCGDRL